MLRSMVLWMHLDFLFKLKVYMFFFLLQLTQPVLIRWIQECALETSRGTLIAARGTNAATLFSEDVVATRTGT